MVMPTFFRKHIIILVAGLVVLFAPMQAFADNHEGLILPDPSIEPADVVSIQMMALQNNDIVGDDLGLRQTWTFAHPDNKAVTGPYERFAKMLRNPAYEPMINHRNFEIIDQKEESGQVRFLIEMETPDNRLYRFVWVVKQVTKGDLVDCWMTSAVSAPMPAGEGS